MQLVAVVRIDIRRGRRAYQQISFSTTTQQTAAEVPREPDRLFRCMKPSLCALHAVDKRPVHCQSRKVPKSLREWQSTLSRFLSKAANPASESFGTRLHYLLLSTPHLYLRQRRNNMYTGCQQKVLPPVSLSCFGRCFCS